MFLRVGFAAKKLIFACLAVIIYTVHYNYIYEQHNIVHI